MPRAIWSGSISFGLVTVPVRMYSAIQDRDVHFHMLHEKDDSRIGYAKVCKKERKPVPDDEIVRAYEVAKGEYVYVTDDDLEAAGGERYRSIDILDFVDVEEVDSIYFERTSYLGPAEGAEKPYALLVRAMEKSGLVAIATYVMRDKQQLGCLRVRDGVILLEKMFFADEIRPAAGLAPTRANVGSRELEMALDLVDRFRRTFDPERYEDTYRTALLEIIERKQRGEEVHAEPAAKREEPTDLLEALRASVEQHSRRATARGGQDGSLSSLRKSELEERARELGIEGRSTMTKDELVEALESV
jgi:DNA end-binding protein Ku